MRNLLPYSTKKKREKSEERSERVVDKKRRSVKRSFQGPNEIEIRKKRHQWQCCHQLVIFFCSEIR